MNTEACFDATEFYAGYDHGYRAGRYHEDIDDHTRYQYSTSEWMDGFFAGYEDGRNE